MYSFLCFLKHVLKQFFQRKDGFIFRAAGLELKAALLKPRARWL